MSTFKKLLFGFFLLGIVFTPLSAAFAAYGLDETAGAAFGNDLGKYKQDVPTLIGNVIGTALSMIAVIFFVLMVYGGFLWMSAHGDSGQIDKAKDTIIAAIIGIIVVLAAYAITNFVFEAVNGTNAPGPVRPDGSLCIAKGGAFACRAIGTCKQDTIERDLCPGDETNVCCEPNP